MVKDVVNVVKAVAKAEVNMGKARVIGVQATARMVQAMLGWYRLW